MGKNICIGNHSLKPNQDRVEGGYETLFGETYYAIKNYDQMPPFFMSLVSASDHWLFISSTGGLSAGRVNAESALFPYYTDDKLTENADNTGPKTIFLVSKGDKTYLWEPFAECHKGLYPLERTLYKNVYGNKLVFEEHNLELGLRYRYAWQTSDAYGFVKSSWLESTLAESYEISLLDGLQNLLPYGATTALQTSLSNLLNAYKKNELEPRTGLGIFTLSSTLTDLAEPSESLKASTVWQVGLDEPSYLLSSGQLDAFRQGEPITQEDGVRGQRGAYFVQVDFTLAANETRAWSLIAEVEQDSANVVSLVNALEKNRADVWAKVQEDIEKESKALRNIVAQADGLQLSGDYLASTHHFANVLFNTMRGGIFADQHTVFKDDLLDFIKVRNGEILKRYEAFFAQLPDETSYGNLVERAVESGSASLERLCREYLPLTFSRRHGDPSRPWNQFSINLKNPDGSRRLDYQGNWRDIFQNWEPLVYAFPAFSEAAVTVFLNATTADGYNPYRMTRSGIEWEKPEPGNPWANIGYWSDHQIIYLQKLLEASEQLHPGALEGLLTRPIFSYANVPYRIKSYAAMLEDAYDTIDFDERLDKDIEAQVSTLGTDAKLLQTNGGEVLHVTMVEKLLVLLLAKLANFVPEGGIWMNTQRPEWNDANNALVGKGLSVVTTAYLRRFVVFFHDLLENCEATQLELNREVKIFFKGVQAALEQHQQTLSSSFDDDERRSLMDALGEARSSYREKLYEQGFTEAITSLDTSNLSSFLDLAQRHLEHTLRANRRSDGLYHAYNILALSEGHASISYLDEMLEGQVAILSSGILSSEEALALLGSLRQSRLYRADQQSYILYPDKTLPTFLEKNRVTAEQVADLEFVATLVAQGDTSLILRDEAGDYHFNGDFRNIKDVNRTLERLEEQAGYAELVKREGDEIRQLFEEVFNHASFTGRSSTFFAFEGLGSIYWHMVSKLLLAVQETYLQAFAAGESTETLSALKNHYYDVRSGIGFNKSPEVYDAFPTDPYSHTPAGQGAKQPGMTGQVKEEILTRARELGLSIESGELVFDPTLLRRDEWLEEQAIFAYVNVYQEEKQLQLPAGSFVYTLCQVPVICLHSNEAHIMLTLADGQTRRISGNRLDIEYSQQILSRSGKVKQLGVYFATDGHL